MRALMKRFIFWPGWIVPAVLVLLTGCNTEHAFVKKIAFKDSRSIVIEFAGELDSDWAVNPAHYKAYEKRDPDVLLAINKIILSPDKKAVTVQFDEEINPKEPHMVSLAPIHAQGQDLGPALLTVKRLYIGELFSILIGAMLINNFVFTKYLGLCVFFGTSKKKDTAVGMGITFTLVMVASAQAGPMLLPYFDSGQADGLIAGLNGAAGAEIANNGLPGLVRRYWDAYSLGLYLAALLITLGSTWHVGIGIRERRAETA